MCIIGQECCVNPLLCCTFGQSTNAFFLFVCFFESSGRSRLMQVVQINEDCHVWCIFCGLKVYCTQTNTKMLGSKELLE